MERREEIGVDVKRHLDIEASYDTELEFGEERQYRMIFGGWKLFWLIDMWTAAYEFKARPTCIKKSSDGVFTHVDLTLVPGPLTPIHPPRWMRVVNYIFARK